MCLKNSYIFLHNNDSERPYLDNGYFARRWHVAMDNSLEDGITRNGKSPNENYLLKQNHQPVCTICNERVGMNIICCSECHCKIHYKCSLLPPYQLYDFIKRKRKYTCANCTPADVSSITPGSVDIEINELKDNLIKIEDINTLLGEENTIIKNSNKVNKANNTNKINELETQLKNLQKSLTESNRKTPEKTKEIHKLERQTPLHKVSQSRQMTGDDIDFRAENNSNLNWELGIYDDFRDFKRFVAMEFQEIKQQMAEITSDKNKQPVIHPTSRNNETSEYQIN